jgi:polysaccharide export outer membrane protein
MQQRLLSLFALVVIAINIFSCRPAKPLQYVEGPYDSTMLKTLQLPDPIIQKGDLLSIIVFSDNPANTALYNQQMGGGSGQGGSQGGSVGGAGQSTIAYLVDNEGNIQFQGLGPLHIEGLTKKQLVELLDSKLKDTLLSNPYYTIRFLNFKVTLIGEFTKPGVYSIPSEKVNILEAIGLAGDINVFGKKDEVTVIRELNGHREITTLNLSDPHIFNSPYYNLQQNDVVVVATNKYKNRQSEDSFFRYISLGTSLLSVAAILITIFKN